jgi:hypothetical protein
VTREKCIKVLATKAELPMEISKEIEHELFRLLHHKMGDEYKAILRRLVFNLKPDRNPELRADVLRRSVRDGAPLV